ncbi:MAG TPA: threonine/serine dehydratase [bacterium]|nr:threonine/serine dehydratase [bacterium]
MDPYADLFEEITAARSRIQGMIRPTPLEHSPVLSRMTEGEVWLKLENWQVTRSFKIRGAANKILSLSETGKNRGVVTSSTGNHGIAVAHVLKKLGVPGIVFLPENTSDAKLRSIRLMETDLEFFGQDCVEAEMHARRFAGEQGKTYVSPYNDPLIVAGQGTVGLEIIGQLEATGSAVPDAVLCPVGGGGLISGLACAFKTRYPSVEIIGCQPENSAVMAHSIKAGRILEMESKPTLSDGTAGGIEPGSVTFSCCRKWVDRFILVPEEEIAAAVRLFLGTHHMVVEGAGALPAAALLRGKDAWREKRVVLLISGGRLCLDTLRTIVREN